MKPNPHVDELLTRCAADKVSFVLARMCLDNYRSRAIEIVGSLLSAEGKQELLASNEKRLIDDLEAILTPPELADLDQPAPPPRYSLDLQPPTGDKP